MALGFVGFLATLGIAVYELRNSQLYEAAIHRAKEFETRLGLARTMKHNQQARLFQAGLFNERPLYIKDECCTRQEWNNLRDPWAFTVNDLQDVGGLIDEVCNFKDDSVWERICKELHQPSTRTDLLQTRVLKALNGLLADESLYKCRRFAQVRLRAEMWDSFDQNPNDEELRRLNRFLLEEAYPKEIHKKKVPWMPFWFVKVKHDRGLALIYGAALGGWVYLISDGLLSLPGLKDYCLPALTGWTPILAGWYPILPMICGVITFVVSERHFANHDKNRFRPSSPTEAEAIAQQSQQFQAAVELINSISRE